MRCFLAFALAVLVALSAAPPLRADPRLDGRAEQGGLVVGHAVPGARVSLDGVAVPVDAAGRFLLGFGRDAAPRATLRIETPGGGVSDSPIDVARRDWAVQRVDGVPRDRAEPDPAAQARLRAEVARLAAIRTQAAASREEGWRDGLIRPADGRESGVFGSQRIYNGAPGAPHSGIDIAALAGAPVRAAAGGRVVLADDLFLTGLTVLIDHGLGLVGTYAHLSRIEVAEGQPVAQGTVIGRVGATGLATGPHLHWGISWLDRRLDPATALAVLARPVP